MTTKQPTPGALRAAEKLCSWLPLPAPTLAVADIIDSETGLPELVEALEVCADWMCEASPGTDQWERGQAARAALAKAKGSA